MNADELEKDLQEQRLRPVPSSWREEILTAARAEAGLLPPSQPRGWWRELLWPCPAAWAGLAAAWVVILGLHLLAGAEPRAARETSLVQALPEGQALMAEQRRLYAEMLAPAPPGPGPARAEPADRPRSQRPVPYHFSAGLLWPPTSADPLA